MVAFYCDVIELEPMRDPQDAPIVFFRIADDFEGHKAVLALFRHDIESAGRAPAGGDGAGIIFAPYRAQLAGPPHARAC
jgi:hypothetical protein